MTNRWISVALVLAMAAAASAAQEKATPQQPEKPEAAGVLPRQAEPAVPLKVSIAISRHRGEKRISSSPYVLGVAANGAPTTLRMGSDVPIVMKPAAGPQPVMIPGQQTYRSVGTNIDCQAFTTPTAGLFRLVVTVTDSSVHVDSVDKAVVPVAVSEAPMFRTFNSSFTILLRDGQSTEYTSATDPVTGEVMKIDVALNVLK